VQKGKSAVEEESASHGAAEMGKTGWIRSLLDCHLLGTPLAAQRREEQNVAQTLSALRS
jgi:hypothetical protein